MKSVRHMLVSKYSGWVPFFTSGWGLGDTFPRGGRGLFAEAGLPSVMESATLPPVTRDFVGDISSVGIVYRGDMIGKLQFSRHEKEIAPLYEELANPLGITEIGGGWRPSDMAGEPGMPLFKSVGLWLLVVLLLIPLRSEKLEMDGGDCFARGIRAPSFDSNNFSDALLWRAGLSGEAEDKF